MPQEFLETVPRGQGFLRTRQQLGLSTDELVKVREAVIQRAVATRLMTLPDSRFGDTVRTPCDTPWPRYDSEHNWLWFGRLQVKGRLSLI